MKEEKISSTPHKIASIIPKIIPKKCEDCLYFIKKANNQYCSFYQRETSYKNPCIAHDVLKARKVAKRKANNEKISYRNPDNKLKELDADNIPVGERGYSKPNMATVPSSNTSCIKRRIICDKCGAKYKISDSELPNKEQSSKCVKCGATIIVPAKKIDHENNFNKGTLSGEESDSWYYALNGERIGPVSHQEMHELAKVGTINQETKVWSNEGDWKPAKDSVLSNLFKKPTSNIPPPLTGDDVDNKFIWTVVMIPLLGIIVELIAGTELIWLYIIANIACLVLDEKKLKAAGQKSPVTWMVFIVPVYLWKRSNLLNQKKHYFWAWIAAFVLSIMIGTGGNQAILTDGNLPHYITPSSKPVVGFKMPSTGKQVVKRKLKQTPINSTWADSLTGPQKNAVRSAKQYLSFKGFSRSGLIKQLSSDYGDGYNVADATVAVNSLNIDWNKQAVRSAKQYLSFKGFSCKGLIQQLSSSAGDGYTESQAAYGARQAGACQ